MPRKFKDETEKILYRTWHHMRDRCLQPNNLNYWRYGGRGITICARWDSFQNFEEDMRPTWVAGLELDREDNNGPYSPENCRWATRLEQCRNISTVTVSDEQIVAMREDYKKPFVTQAQLAKKYNCSRTAVGSFLRGERRAPMLREEREEELRLAKENANA